MSPFEQILRQQLAAAPPPARRAPPGSFADGLRTAEIRAAQQAELPRCLRVLGLRLPCTRQQVRRAFRRLAHGLHPDRGGSHAGFVALERAYEQALALAA